MPLVNLVLAKQYDPCPRVGAMIPPMYVYVALKEDGRYVDANTIARMRDQLPPTTCVVPGRILQSDSGQLSLTVIVSTQRLHPSMLSYNVQIVTPHST